jgi:hypothetical protein
MVRKFWLNSGTKCTGLLLLLLLLLLGRLWGFPAEPTAAYRAAPEVYADLLSYLQLDPGHAPQLTINPVSTRGAAYDLPSNQLLVDRKLIRRLQTAFSPSEYEAALTLVLGHELGHFFQQRPCGAFSLIGLAKPAGGAHLSTLQALELEADYYGAFALHLTEKATPRICGSLLALLAEVYGDAPAYPSLASRQQMYRQAEARTQQLLQCYRLGVQLALTDYPAEALASGQRLYQAQVGGVEWLLWEQTIGFAQLPATAWPFASPTDFTALCQRWGQPVFFGQTFPFPYAVFERPGLIAWLDENQRLVKLSGFATAW